MDKELIIELLDLYTDNLCKTIDGKMYELITRSQLLKILEDYKSKDEEIKRLHSNISIKDTEIDSRCEDYLDAEAEIKKLRDDRKELIKNIKYFIDRVEAGTIRSRKTYAIYKNLLNRLKEGE